MLSDTAIPLSDTLDDLDDRRDEPQDLTLHLAGLAKADDSLLKAPFMAQELNGLQALCLHCYLPVVAFTISPTWAQRPIWGKVATGLLSEIEIALPEADHDLSGYG